MPHRIDLPPAAERRPVDPNTYLAAERTFLAWIRTGLAMMGFGFVVARFGLFLREMAANGHTVTHGMSVTSGTALVVLGVTLTLASMGRYVHILRQLERGQGLGRPSKLAIALGAGLAAIGSAISVYLLLTA